MRISMIVVVLALSILGCDGLEPCGEQRLCLEPNPVCCSGNCTALGTCPEGQIVCPIGYYAAETGQCVRRLSCAEIDNNCGPNRHCELDPETGSAVCVCNIGHTGDGCNECIDGYHLEAAVCKPDEKCPSACPVDEGIATCDDSTGVIVCTCNEHRVRPPECLCEVGYHEVSRPMGPVCVEDASCQEDSCPEYSTCTVNQDLNGITCDCYDGRERAGDRCVCKEGTHDEDGVCKKDATCEDVQCNPNAYCKVKEDLSGTVCLCKTGYTGIQCEECDEGYETVDGVCLTCEHQCERGERGCMSNGVRYECQIPPGSTCRHKIEYVCDQLDHFCSDGDCVCNHECAVGTGGCYNETSGWLCELYAPSGCRRKIDNTCGQDNVCSMGTCVCDHECPLGSAGCVDGMTTWRCLKSEETGCRKKVESICEGQGLVCTAGECVCDHECSVGTGACTSETTGWQCGVSEETGCRQKIETTCDGQGQVCSAGACVCDNECLSGSIGCDGETTRWECLAFEETGCRFKRQIPCQPAESCADGACVCNFEPCGDRCCLQGEYCNLITDVCTVETELSPDVTHEISYFGTKVKIHDDLIAATGYDKITKRSGCVRYYNLGEQTPFQTVCGPDEHQFASEIAISTTHVLVNDFDPDRNGDVLPKVRFYRRSALNDDFEVESEAQDFGRKLDIDGNWAVVTASKNNDTVLLMYKNTGNNTWVQTQEIPEPDPDDYNFGYAVAIAGDWLLATSITSNHYGVVHVFQYRQSTWSHAQVFDLPDVGDWTVTTMEAKGDRVVIGALKLKRAYVLRRSDSSQYMLERKLIRDDLNNFGQAVSIDGDLVAVGADIDGGGVVVLYRNLEEVGQYVGTQQTWECCYGCSLGVSQYGLVVGDPYAHNDRGAVYVY